MNAYRIREEAQTVEVDFSTEVMELDIQYDWVDALKALPGVNAFVIRYADLDRDPRLSRVGSNGWYGFLIVLWDGDTAPIADIRRTIETVYARILQEVQDELGVGAE